MAIGLTSGDVVDPATIGLEVVEEPDFLIELIIELEAAVSRGLGIGRRLGWDGDRDLWRFGMLHRAYFVPNGDRADQEHEPDKFCRGIAPSVKLLHTVVLKLADLDVAVAKNFIERWQKAGNAVHIRLWAALSRDPRLGSPAEIGAFLLSCTDRQFWDLHSFPEIAELRARRFTGLSLMDQNAILRRIRKRPPKNHWPRDIDRERVEEARMDWTLRELRRIEIAGGHLPKDQCVWFTAQLEQFTPLREMSRLDEGFQGSPKASFVPPNPDDRYDLLEGLRRLDALEVALGQSRPTWDEDPASRAADWIRQSGRADIILCDLEATADAGTRYPKVWEVFGWTHAPSPQRSGLAGEGENQALEQTAERVLSLLERLLEKTAAEAIEGIATWLSVWEQQIKNSHKLLGVWTRLWPIAVEATNAQQQKDAAPDLNVLARITGDREPTDLDTLNTPAGKLVAVLLAAALSVNPGDRPFDTNESLRVMRDAAIAASGRSGLIARHRMIETLAWFLVADPEWTQEKLVAPLLDDTTESLPLWRAIARRTHFSDVLRVIGDAMAERANDLRLGRETRNSLAWSVVLESLHAFREARKPVVPNARVQQMLRSLDDETRAHAAEAIQRFLRGLSAKTEIQPNPPTAESLFRGAARPFLQQVWPQERPLATLGVARALAEVPAASGDAFVEAVEAIERFLVPFDCWSLFDFGFNSEREGEPGLSHIDNIDNVDKAKALLILLDRTIGRAEGAVFPRELGSALEQVHKVAPHLAETSRYRRLAALARR